MPGKMRSFLNLFTVVYLLFGVALGAGIMFLTGTIDSKAAFGFVGVIIGSLITGATSWLAARENRKQHWAIAAIDKRLEVHQEAYALWTRIVGALNDQNIAEVVSEGEKWWSQNCLYLDAASRQAFKSCLFSALLRKDLLNGPKPRDDETTKMIRKNWHDIMKPGQTLPAGVALPGMGEQELGPEHKP